jgi:hypothetical protein
MIDAASLRRRPPVVDRSSDRRIAMAAIVVSITYLVAAVVTLAVPATRDAAPWLPLHLALAGGATTAIAGVMPFFAAAFAAAPPSDARLRSATVTAVAGGALLVTVGVSARIGWLAVGGGTLFIVGALLIALVTVRPLRGAFGPSRGIVVQGYVAACVAVATGATIATLFVAGLFGLADGWAAWRAAHAWLNLFAFVSLVIATTLLHFFPTVIGARIANHPTARLTVFGIGGGAAVTALGVALGLDLPARAGALGVLAGAASLVAYAVRVWRTRAAWTTDHAWHRFAMGGLASAIAWFGVGTTVAAGRVLLLGADPAAWQLSLVVGPLVAGWVGLAIVASATHLVPAVGPGDPIDHAGQRAMLGRGATVRLALIDAGVAGLSVGLAAGSEALAAAGLAALGGGLGASAVLIAIAVRLGLRQDRDRVPGATSPPV